MKILNINNTVFRHLNTYLFINYEIQKQIKTKFLLKQTLLNINKFSMFVEIFINFLRLNLTDFKLKSCFINTNLGEVF